MLGTEPQLIADYVEDGRVRLVFWPVLNHGDPSVYATLTAHCIGQQNADAFWDVHNLLFENQRELWSASRDYYVNVATSLGVDQAAFERCYDDGTGLAEVLALDEARKQRGVYGQPTFELEDTLYGGAPPYEVFTEMLDAALANQPTP